MTKIKILKDLNSNEYSKPLLRLKIDKITYLVGVHFSKTSKETLEEKINRMIRRDLQKGNSD